MVQKIVKKIGGEIWISFPATVERMNSAPRRAAGAVVFRRTDRGVRLLVLRAYKNWDFPKGLIEPGETELDAAKRRGARIYAEVLGCAANSDGNHLPQPSEEGQAHVMSQVIAGAPSNPRSNRTALGRRPQAAAWARRAARSSGYDWPARTGRSPTV